MTTATSRGARRQPGGGYRCEVGEVIHRRSCTSRRRVGASSGSCTSWEGGRLWRQWGAPAGGAACGLAPRWLPPRPPPLPPPSSSSSARGCAPLAVSMSSLHSCMSMRCALQRTVPWCSTMCGCVHSTRRATRNIQAMATLLSYTASTALVQYGAHATPAAVVQAAPHQQRWQRRRLVQLQHQRLARKRHRLPWRPPRQQRQPLASPAHWQRTATTSSRPCPCGRG